MNVMVVTTFLLIRQIVKKNNERINKRYVFIYV